MKSKIFKFIVTVVSLVIITGCNNSPKKGNKTIEEAVIDYYSERFNFEYGPLTDYKVFLNQHRDEILETIEIAETREVKEKNVAIAYVRFSIGADIIRSTLWLRKLNGNWTKTFINPAEYQYEYLGYEEKTDELETIFEKIEEWEQDNPKVWWLEYL